MTKSLHETVKRYLQAISHIANLVQLSYATSTVYLCIYLFIKVDVYIYIFLFDIHVHFVFHLSRIPRDEEGDICCEHGLVCAAISAANLGSVELGQQSQPFVAGHF